LLLLLLLLLLLSEVFFFTKQKIILSINKEGKRFCVECQNMFCKILVIVIKECDDDGRGLCWLVVGVVDVVVVVVVVVLVDE
jgi:hypothetical protein